MKNGKWQLILRILALVLLFVALFFWGLAIFRWLRGEQEFEAWTVLFAAIISTLLSFISFLRGNKITIRESENLMIDRKQNLHKALTSHLNEDEFRDICFQINIDFDDLGGVGKSSKIRELILFLERRNRLSDLVEAVSSIRPDIAL